jgi:hypothetical protein
MMQTETPGYSKAGIFGGNESPVLSIRMRHVLFEACTHCLAIYLTIFLNSELPREPMLKPASALNLLLRLSFNAN